MNSQRNNGNFENLNISNKSNFNSINENKMSNESSIIAKI